MAYTVTFWGTRGSIPTPGAHTARYGGNTPCVAVEGSGGGQGGGGGQLGILDAGPGIRALGRGLGGGQKGAGEAGVPPAPAGTGERRGGEEGRCRWGAHHLKKKKKESESVRTLRSRCAWEPQSLTRGAPRCTLS